MRLHLPLLVMLLIPAVARAQATQPTTAPAAIPVLDGLRDAYAKLQTLELAGTLAFEADAAGQKQSQKIEFTSSFRAPANLRHESKDDVLLVSNGEKAYVYKIDQKRYQSLDAPKERADSSELPETMLLLLSQQNPSLLLAMSKDAAATLIEGAEAIDVEPDVNGCAVLKLNQKEETIRVLVDRKTNLMRQFSIDMKQQLIARGVPMVNSAVITIDYTKSQAGAQLADASFTWTAPADAMLVKPVEEAVAESDDQAGQALTGKVAPAFALKDLAGNEVALAKLKGTVVVLDFWASWCGPCIAGLPHVATLEKDMAPKGAKVFAVNVAETQAVVTKFLKEKELNLTVLLDGDGKVSAQYKAPPIPQTYVIGKDGKIRKVFVGYGPGAENKVREAVEAALGE